MFKSKKYRKILKKIEELDDSVETLLLRSDQNDPKITALCEIHDVKIRQDDFGYKHIYCSHTANTEAAGKIALQDIASLVIDGKPIEVKTEETKYVTQHCQLQTEGKTSEVSYSLTGDVHAGL